MIKVAYPVGKVFLGFCSCFSILCLSFRSAWAEGLEAFRAEDSERTLLLACPLKEAKVSRLYRNVDARLQQLRRLRARRLNGLALPG